MSEGGRPAGEGPDTVEFQEARAKFLKLVADLRPELHRYCARMVGSVVDGEDLVQDAIIRAYYALSDLDEVPALRPWLFRIAHNCVLDRLRRRARGPLAPDEGGLEAAADESPPADDLLANGQAVRAAVTRFLELAPSQRSCVILKDVLGHSLEEVADLLSLSVPAVKASLHRGRERLRASGPAGAPAPREPSQAAVRYAASFNAHDWDAVRAMLAEDVRLDLVSQSKRSGRRDVGAYVSNYARTGGVRLAPALVDGREALVAVREPGGPNYLIEIEFSGDMVASIRDFRYAPYVLEGAEIVPAPPERTPP